MKKLFYLIVIVLFLGIWLGINFAKDQPFFSNPFADKAIAEKAKQTAREVAREAQETVEKVFDDKTK